MGGMGGGGGLQALTAAHALVQVSAQDWGVSCTFFMMLCDVQFSCGARFGVINSTHTFRTSEANHSICGNINCGDA